MVESTNLQVWKMNAVILSGNMTLSDYQDSLSYFAKVVGKPKDYLNDPGDNAFLNELLLAWHGLGYFLNREGAQSDAGKLMHTCIQNSRNAVETLLPEGKSLKLFECIADKWVAQGNFSEHTIGELFQDISLRGRTPEDELDFQWTLLYFYLANLLDIKRDDLECSKFTAAFKDSGKDDPVNRKRFKAYTVGLVYALLEPGLENIPCRQSIKLHIESFRVNKAVGVDNAFFFHALQVHRLRESFKEATDTSISTIRADGEESFTKLQEKFEKAFYQKLLPLAGIFVAILTVILTNVFFIAESSTSPESILIGNFSLLVALSFLALLFSIISSSDHRREKGYAVAALLLSLFLVIIIF